MRWPWKSAPSHVTAPGCSCDWLDMGPRCDYCVALCTEKHHPSVPSPSNGKRCMCGAGPVARAYLGDTP